MTTRAALTPEQRHEALKLIRLTAVPPYAAFGEFGVNQHTFELWMSRARKHREKPEAHPLWIWDALLLDDIERVQAQCQIDLALVVRTNKSRLTDIDPDRKSAQYLLERRYARDWSATAKHEVSGPNGGPIANLDLTSLTDEQLDRIAAGEDAAKVVSGTSSGGNQGAA